MKKHKNDSCEKILLPTEWKLLWVKLEGKTASVTDADTEMGLSETGETEAMA